MSYSILFVSEVLKEDIPALDTEVRRRAKEAIESKLTAYPEAFGKPLRYTLRNHKALRVGDYRIVYRIDGNTVRVTAIVHRREVYRVAGLRV